jgi:translation initiation factor IF-2
VIALFKSSRKGIIIGCEILDGYLAQGKRFRLISAMGPVYSGSIESMQIERKAVQKATRGAQLGIKIRDFKNARIGDLVESFQSSASKRAPVWRPRAEVIQKRSE